MDTAITEQRYKWQLCYSFGRIVITEGTFYAKNIRQAKKLATQQSKTQSWNKNWVPHFNGVHEKFMLDNRLAYKDDQRVLCLFIDNELENTVEQTDIDTYTSAVAVGKDIQTDRELTNDEEQLLFDLLGEPNRREARDQRGSVLFTWFFQKINLAVLYEHTNTFEVAYSSKTDNITSNRHKELDLPSVLRICKDVIEGNRNNITYENNKIHCGDTLKLVRHIPNNSISLIVCDGPYGVTEHEWDNVANIQNYNKQLLTIFKSKLLEGGALYLFGKHNAIDFMDYKNIGYTLQSRIIWYSPARLAQGRNIWTNNYDTIFYFIKGNKARHFNLEAVRVPQLTELTHRQRCESVPSVKSGEYGNTVYNPKGKNPGDVWGDIKQLTYNSKELLSRDTLNTIQKPELLIQRIVKASSKKGDLVFDPFCGTGTCPVVCKELGRDFIAFEKDETLVKEANKRLNDLVIQPGLGV